MWAWMQTHYRHYYCRVVGLITNAIKNPSGRADNASSSRALINSLDQFNYYFDNLRQAKSLLRSLVNSLPEKVSTEYMNKGLGLNHGEGMDACKCVVPSQHGGTLNNDRATSPLLRLVEREGRWEAPDHSQSVLSQNWGGTEQIRTVTYMIIDFSSRLTKTLNVFYDVIGNLDLQSGSEQLTPAENAFDSNSAISGDNRYTKEVKKLINENKEAEDPNKPRGVYTNWGKRTCGNKASNILYIGYMASFMEQGIGAGTEYQCLPENPNLNVDSDATGLDPKSTRLAAVRYMNMSIFRGSGKQIQDKVAPCTVCETPLRPTVKMFPSMHICPGDWVPEYNGYLVANYHGKLRSRFVCVNIDPDTYNFNNKVKGEPYVLPVKMGSQEGSTYTTDASIPCAVCSK
ncbi:stonustoxin subunit alpha [Trichonephila clavipes]|nr:stonustoxin subunit alpha [Trichonephila clavipes]